MVIDADIVLDLGSATGAALKPLAKRFRKSSVIAVDISRQMTRKCRARRRWPRPQPVVQADARALPFADASVDVVFSNLLLPMIDEPSVLAAEVARVLRRNGLFVFSSLGPDSFSALRAAWAAIDEGAHVLDFPDMHDVGDAMVRAGLSDPVLDVDRLEVSYGSPERLFADLTAVGGRNSLAARNKGLTARRTFERLLAALSQDLPLRVEFELVYGHCWGSGQARNQGAIRIDPGDIPIRQK